MCMLQQALEIANLAAAAQPVLTLCGVCWQRACCSLWLNCLFTHPVDQ